MKVAVLGAGFQGVCVALELAKQGIACDLYDQGGVPITQAGLINEGKIHLGYVYGKDPTLKTARKMLKGALTFHEYLNRWMDFDSATVKFSRPFKYLVHKDSILELEQSDSYFANLEMLYEEMMGNSGLTYLGLNDHFFFEKVTDLDGYSDEIVASYQTIERSVDPLDVASGLRREVMQSDLIYFLGHHLVQKVEAKGNVYAVRSSNANSSPVKEYSHLINCLWGGRYKIDRDLGLDMNDSIIVRYKVAIHLTLRNTHDLPSFTIIQGPFGDLVNFTKNRIYLSWYPSCMIGIADATNQPNWDDLLSDSRRDQILNESLTRLGAIMPELPEVICQRSIQTKKIEGGLICARGREDITSTDSDLHHRYEIGLHSVGDYHSVDTGKYSMAPYFAVQVVKRITG